MEQPAEIPLHADRHTPFFREIAFVIGRDFTGATFLMHVRLTPETPGAALIDLTNTLSTTAQGVRLAYADVDTVANHILALRLPTVPQGMELDTPVFVNVLSIQITEAAIESLTFPADKTTDMKLAYDLQITPSGGNKEVYAKGDFIVRAGVTAS